MEAKETNISNYITLSRNIFDHWVAQNKDHFFAFVWMIKEARFLPTETKQLIGGTFLTWNRGQFPASIRFLLKAWKWKNIAQVQRFLKKLVLDGMITIDIVGGQQIITIVNYESYNFKTGKNQYADQYADRYNKADTNRYSETPSSKEIEAKADTLTDTENDTLTDTESDTGCIQGVDKTNKVQKRNKVNKENNTLSEASASGEKGIYLNIEKTINGIYKYIVKEKPTILQPYIDLWNLFAPKYSLTIIRSIEGEREKKLKARLKEESFEFLKILEKLSTRNQFAHGQWLTLDWLIKNKTNYLTVLEGKYDAVESSTTKNAKNVVNHAKIMDRANSLLLEDMQLPGYKVKSHNEYYEIAKEHLMKKTNCGV